MDHLKKFHKNFIIYQVLKYFLNFILSLHLHTWLEHLSKIKIRENICAFLYVSRPSQASWGQGEGGGALSKDIFDHCFTCLTT
jgi:hypothetical protein